LVEVFSVVVFDSFIVSAELCSCSVFSVFDIVLIAFHPHADVVGMIIAFH
jgi:hypothetical protein